MMLPKTPCPCESCRLVCNPQTCQDKECSLWRVWFVCRWNAMRRCWLREDTL